MPLNTNSILEIFFLIFDKFKGIEVETIDDVEEIFFLPTNRSFTNTCNNISLLNYAKIENNKISWFELIDGLPAFNIQPSITKNVIYYDFF